MSVVRADRVGDQMMRELGDLIRASLRDPAIPLCTSVTRVEVTRDLSHANVYVSVLGELSEQEACIRALTRAAGFLRREVAGRIRIHHAPELHFHLDNSVQEGLRMSRMIDEALAQDARMRADSGQEE